MHSCLTCDRQLSPVERYCTSCGEPASGLIGTTHHRSSTPSSRFTRCPHCDHANKAGEPFCARCGFRTVSQIALLSCRECGTIATDETARFCPACGSRLRGDKPEGSGNTSPRGLPTVEFGPRLTVLDENGSVSEVIRFSDGRANVSAANGNVQAHDARPDHEGVTVSLNGGDARLEPVGNPRALFVFITGETVLADHDVVLVGSQVIRVRAEDEPDTAQPPAPAGSVVPGADVAVLEQLRADGRVRDTLHLWRGRSALIGREEGDWLFPYDRTMSARHAVVSCDADGTIRIRDIGSRNGVAVAVREAHALSHGQRVSLDGQILRVDLA